MQTLVDLFTAPALLILLAFCFCLVGRLYFKSYRKALSRCAVLFGVLSLLFSSVTYTALFKSGPLRGIVINKSTGQPMAGVTVYARWFSSISPLGFTPKFLQWNCEIGSEPMVTDQNGRFAAYRWHGAKVWHGCFHALGLGKYLRVAVIMDDRILTTRARLITSTTPAVTDLRSKAIKGQTRQSQREIASSTFPYVVEAMFNKRGRISSARPTPFYLNSGADPQPNTDQGPLDVGNLLPSFLSTDLPNAATFQFPDAAQSVGACPGPTCGICASSFGEDHPLCAESAISPICLWT